MARQFYFDPTKLLPGDEIFVVKTDSNFVVSTSPSLGTVGRPSINIVPCVVQKSVCVASRHSEVTPLIRTWTFTVIPKCLLPDGIKELNIFDKSVAFTSYIQATKWIQEVGEQYADSDDGHKLRQKFYNKFKTMLD